MLCFILAIIFIVVCGIVAIVQIPYIFFCFITGKYFNDLVIGAIMETFENITFFLEKKLKK